MGEVVALRSKDTHICESARKIVWERLTRDEQDCVALLERDYKLFRLFDSLHREYLRVGRFVIPEGTSAYQRQQLLAMHRFTDELTYHIATFREAKAFVDDFRYGLHQMPA